MGLVIERDVNELVEEHSELTTVQLRVIVAAASPARNWFEEEPEVEITISASEIKEILGMWESFSSWKETPEKLQLSCIGAFNDTCLTHFAASAREEETNLLDSFLIAKKAKTSEEESSDKI
ncbi:hypothetical protein AVEN_187566-1 [Araneus ventricosus]|uniref:Uncharacterized protein n=1 Tax=Araneus ventricosus TaxID=182803 RepID=A0A4Y2RBR9_ARAVE|nr:hypothetical protein AVEN_187566-1 [Araneus ventricosus]